MVTSYPPTTFWCHLAGQLPILFLFCFLFSASSIPFGTSDRPLFGLGNPPLPCFLLKPVSFIPALLLRLGSHPPPRLFFSFMFYSNRSPCNAYWCDLFLISPAHVCPPDPAARFFLVYLDPGPRIFCYLFFSNSRSENSTSHETPSSALPRTTPLESPFFRNHRGASNFFS